MTSSSNDEARSPIEARMKESAQLVIRTLVIQSSFWFRTSGLSVRGLDGWGRGGVEFLWD